MNAANTRYQIRVAGQLAPRWAASFDGMTITPADDGTTAIHGLICDQAALHAMFRRLADLGLTIISVSPMAEDSIANPADQPGQLRTTKKEHPMTVLSPATRDLRRARRPSADDVDAKQRSPAACCTSSPLPPRCLS